MKNRKQENEFSKPTENNASFLTRFFIYQNERFPLLGHGLLVASFTFSAIAYSRICRGVPGFVSWRVYVAGIFITISLFFLVRIFDEFKDADDDAKYRRELPVPRGLIRFSELRNMAIAIFIFQFLVIALCFPKMIWMYIAIIAYLLLMTKEFFVSKWLKAHPFWYVTSHMFIIPFIDMFASGLDWLLAGAPPPKGLLFFFGVSYMNGIVLEVGRKIRTPQKEATGVLTYSSMLGANKSIGLWLLVLVITFIFSICASAFAGYGVTGFILLVIVFGVCIIPALLFLKSKKYAYSKGVEYASALWTIAMYLTLGGVPMLRNLIFK